MIPSGGGGVLTTFFRHQRIKQRTVHASIEKQLDLKDPIASRGGSVPVFLSKPILLCDFPGGGGEVEGPSGSAHVVAVEIPYYLKACFV